jgi:hypothetical protein
VIRIDLPEGVVQPGAGPVIEMRRNALKVGVIRCTQAICLVEKLKFRREIRNPL